MKKIYIIGDVHTVSALRLLGVTGVVCTKDQSLSRLEEVMAKGDAGIVVIINELAADLTARIMEINLSNLGPVVITIPGIDDTKGLIKSEVAYIAEALGIAL